MLTFPDLKNLLAEHGFGSPTNIDHVARSLRDAGLISAGAKTPMTAEDAVAMMLGMSCRGTVREKFFNVEALLAMRFDTSREEFDFPANAYLKARGAVEGGRFGETLAAILRHLPDMVEEDRLTVHIQPDLPSATILAYDTRATGDKLASTTWGAPKGRSGVIWSCRFDESVLQAVSAAL